LARTRNKNNNKNNGRSYEEIEAELKFLKRGRKAETIAVLGQSAFRWGGLAYIAYCGSEAVRVLAGEATTAKIGIELVGNMHVSVAIAWSFGVAGIIYGFAQRKLRKDVIERLAGRTSKLEKEIDIRRSSSRLTARGDTPEEIL
jgi:p-aminobenzoyl-glutamate transporter AbgT